MLQYVIALVSILTFIVLIFKKPTVETYVLFVVSALPFIDTKILPLDYGFVKVYDVVSVLSVVIFFKEFISFKPSGKGKIYVILVILFWVFLLLSKMNSAYPTNNLYYLYQPFTIFIFTRFLLIYLKKENALLKFVTAFKRSVIFLAAVIFLQLIFGVEVSYHSGLNPNVVSESTGLIRYPSLFNDSQTCGQFLAMGSFSLLFNPSISSKKRNMHFIGFAFCLVAIFLAGSRSAILGFAIALIFLFLFQPLKIKIIGVSLLVIASVLLVVISPKEGVFSRTENISEDYLFRKSIWEETQEIVAQYPVLGIGLGNFQKYIKKNKQDLYLQVEDGGDFLYFDQPENGYLKVLVEQGYSGFILFILLLTLPTIKVISRAIKKEIKLMNILPVAGFLSWAVAFNTVYSLFDYRILIAVATYLCLNIHTIQKKRIDLAMKNN